MQLPQRLFNRDPSSHKGNFGHVLVVAGSVPMSGAALLAARAALRSGAGLVTIGVPETIVSSVSARICEEMILPLPATTEGSIALSAGSVIKKVIERYDVLIIGPGMSSAPETQQLIRKVSLACRVRTLIDADALNAWAGHVNEFRVGISCLSVEPHLFRIITPHPGEFARLVDVDVQEVVAQKQMRALNFSKEYNVVTLIKGNNTVVADPSGSWYENATGNSGMSTAGSGDVLSGVIAAFWAQGLTSFEAAKYGVYVHGIAGDLAAKNLTQVCMIASDIIAYLPDAMKKVAAENENG